MSRFSGVSPARFELTPAGALPPAGGALPPAGGLPPPGALYSQMSSPKRMDENENEKYSRVTLHELVSEIEAAQTYSATERRLLPRG